MIKSMMKTMTAAVFLLAVVATPELGRPGVAHADASTPFEWQLHLSNGFHVGGTSVDLPTAIAQAQDAISDMPMSQADLDALNAEIADALTTQADQGGVPFPALTDTSQ